MALTALAVHRIAELIRDCVCAALDQATEEIDGYPGCPCRSCVVAGVPAWEDCQDPCSGEAGGQLTVHLERMYPSSRFPEEDRQVRGTPGCPQVATTAAEFVVTVLRCAPMGTADGCPPTCEELEETARTVHVDASVVYSALLCCLPHTAGRRGRRFILGQSRTVGPEGGCVGVEQRVTVALPGCGRCPGEGSSP